MLHSDNPNDFTHSIWKIKKKIYSQCDLHIVTPSQWLGKCASQSSLFRNVPRTVIPNGIDTKIYHPVQVAEAKKCFGLEDDRYYILFGAVNAASDTNKGYQLLLEAINYIKLTTEKKIEIIIFGTDKPTDFKNLVFPVHFTGMITDEQKLVQLYNAADVMVVPSKSENLSNSIIESMACGTPVVGFNIGGNSDIIDHKQNGYLAEPFNTLDLADGITWCLKNNIDNTLSVAARRGVEAKFGLDIVVSKYLEVYEKVINK
jgi:glycosyltransferase involved in cell wall biosynthesis